MQKSMSVTLMMRLCVMLGPKPVMEAFALIQEEGDALSCCATWFLHSNGEVGVST